MHSMINRQEHIDSAKKHPSQPHLVFGLSSYKQDFFDKSHISQAARIEDSSGEPESNRKRLQHEIFLENEDQALRRLMRGLTSKIEAKKEVSSPQIASEPRIKHDSSDANFKLEDLQSCHEPERESRWANVVSAPSQSDQ